ncbi:MAG TPA: PIN domain-containing protein [Thermomicrobiales bacterium]
MRLTLRLVGLAIGLTLGFLAGDLVASVGHSTDARTALLLIALGIGGIGYVLGPHVSWAIFRNLKKVVAETSTLDLVAVGAGFTFGALIGALLAVPLSFLPEPFGRLIPFVVAIVTCSLSTAVALLRKRDLIAPLVNPRLARANAASTAAESSSHIDAAVLLDTNILIDGRIVDLIATGFLDNRLLVPRFVLDELQRIADSDDPLRRTRGRRGLDTLNRIRQDEPDKLEVVDSAVPEEREVDAKLVHLAKERGIRVLTNDYNLDRVAQVQGVEVINLNRLTNALRPMVLPGEEIKLKVVQEGREAGQGVGFLDDGTMVVVDGGKPLVGTQTQVTVTRLLQTGAGRMVFASPKHVGS